MKNVIVLLGMMACLFGPTTIFTLVGYKSLEAVSSRPTDSARVMIALITKLVIVTVLIVGVLAGLLKAFAK